MNFASVILEKFSNAPLDEIYLHCDGESLTYREFIHNVHQTTKQLQKNAVKKGDRVFVFADNLYFWSDLIAVWACGAVAVPIELNIAAEKLMTLVEKAAPILCLSSQDKKGLISNVPVLDRTHIVEDMPFQIEATDSNDLAALYFTSGSTGTPKGAMLTHFSIYGNAKATLERIGLTSHDHLCIATPFHFTSAICHFLSTTLSGAKFTCTLKKFFHKDLYEYVIHSGANAFGGSPIQLSWINQCLQGNEKLIWMMSSGDHLSKNLIEDLLKKLPQLKLFVVYGLTELSGRYCILDPQDLQKHLGSVGKPIAGLNLQVLNDELSPAEVGEIGSIYAAGEYVFQGYFRDAERSNKAFLENLFRTGDMGYLDENGFLYLSGRDDDVFKCAGQKVSSLVIADALRESKFFTDFAVIPKEHPMIGKVPCVYYVLNEGEEFLQGNLLKVLRTKLDALHLPQIFIQVPSIPRTGSGKINRAELGKLIAITS